MSREPGTSIRLMVVDDQDLYRRGLAILIAAQDDIEVVAEAASSAEAVEFGKAAEPDVVLLDVSLNEADGASWPEIVAELMASAKVLMLASSEAEPGLQRALVCGASGYLLKRASIEQVAGAVRAAVNAQTPLG
ncbi:MAG: response regulator [Actinomycetota bacterium]|nr:response regulator transcription factor [Nocardioidaceae bacterium]MDQ3481245.1 response regulator [Actinomycetota bacterium]